MEPIKATLSKQRIGAILQRIKYGEALEPESAAWSLIDCLTVAGVLLSSALSTGAHARPKESGSGAGAAKMLKDLQATIEFIGVMATAHDAGTWDEFFEPSVTVGIRADGGVTPLAGFKQ
jgi:hypothetical protein